MPMHFTKTGPKRLRHTRRELPYGQKSLWGKTEYHFKREREKAIAKAERKAQD